METTVRAGYRLRDKRKRNQEIVEFHHRNPELTVREIAPHFHISASRVQQILVASRKAKA